MLRNYFILPGIIILALSLVISALYYSGASQYDQDSIGYDREDNYLVSFWSVKEVNDGENARAPGNSRDVVPFCQLLIFLH